MRLDILPLILRGDMGPKGASTELVESPITLDQWGVLKIGQQSSIYHQPY